MFNYQRITLPYLWHSTLQVQNDVVLVSDSRFRPSRVVAVWLHCPLLVASCVAAVRQPLDDQSSSRTYQGCYKIFSLSRESTVRINDLMFEGGLERKMKTHAYIFRNNILPSFSEERKKSIKQLRLIHRAAAKFRTKIIGNDPHQGSTEIFSPAPS